MRYDGTAELSLLNVLALAWQRKCIRLLNSGMTTAIKPPMLMLCLWLVAASTPTDSTQRGKSFSCSYEPGPIKLSTSDPKKLHEEDFVAPIGYRLWSLEGLDYGTPGDTATARAITGRMIYESGEDGSGFALRVNYAYANEKGEPASPEETRRFGVNYPITGSAPQFEGVTVDVVQKVSNADTLGLILHGVDGTIELEYRIHISSRLGKGTFERLERRDSGPWGVRLSYRLTK